MNKLIIIPDVHGRTFWKEEVYRVIENEEDTHIVFLGDYVDPYQYECITPEESIPILKEIIDIKKRCPKQVTLLLGNHDLGYIWSEINSCRRDRVNYKDISKIFKDNIDLFDLAYKQGNYLFTHAGVHKYWFDLVFGVKEDYSNIDIYLNNWLHTDKVNIEYYLGMYSFFRGDIDCNFGSCVWADVREWSFDLGYSEENKKLGFYQIFGHTQLEIEPIVRDDFSCIDVRRYFILEDDILIDPQHPTGEWKYNLNKKK